VYLPEGLKEYPGTELQVHLSLVSEGRFSSCILTAEVFQKLNKSYDLFIGRNVSVLTSIEFAGYISIIFNVIAMIDRLFFLKLYTETHICTHPHTHKCATAVL
jgi:hypothetical protein